MKIKGNNCFKAVIIVSVIIAIWYIISALGIFSSYVFPGPDRVVTALIAMVKSGELFVHLLSSSIRVLTGFIIAFVLAFLLGIVVTIFPNIISYFRPILGFLRQVPPMSLIPLLILWFGIGETSKIIVIVLTSFFPIFMNTVTGIRRCDEKLLEVGKMLHMTKADIFLKIRIPYAFPNILVGMRIGLGYSFRAIVGAEMIAATSGIGYMILDANAMSRTDKVVTGIIILGCLGLLVDWIFEILVRKVTKNGNGQNTI